MKSLSLQAINESSSYEVSVVYDGCYQFFTDHGVHCSVEFVLDDLLMSRETYHLDGKRADAQREYDREVLKELKKQLLIRQ